ncbi:MAG TPA: hypothetical protein DCL44_10920 [Elusimicrobia bacterium]|nr:hypothetical protein [Elusimicrobiota bacterium]
MNFSFKIKQNHAAIFFMCLFQAVFLKAPGNLFAQNKSIDTVQAAAIESALATAGVDKKFVIENSPLAAGVEKGFSIKDIKASAEAEKEPDSVIAEKIKKEKKPENRFAAQQMQEIPKGPQKFGAELFYPARGRIRMMEKGLTDGWLPETNHRDALTGFVGPLDMAAAYVNATMPPSYILNPGDQLIINFWGDNIELMTVKLLVDEKGEVGIPKVGMLVVRGMSLPQFQEAVKKQLDRVFRGNVSLIATLDKLRSIQIFVTGEAFRPGNYAVSAVSTLFNALYACGGPNDNGSLRDIKLIRDGKTSTVDFYSYLINGDSAQDYPLLAGDVIFISKARKQVTIDGEVYRPAIYELKEEAEKLSDLIKLADGVKPTAVKQQVQIISVIPNKERVIMDIDLTKEGPSSNPVLIDNDTVMIFTVPMSIGNMVTLEGKAARPGKYELKKDMRVADLFTAINPPLGEAYLDRADIIRLNKDRKTTALLSVDLGKALAKDLAHNIPLYPMDRIIVYSKWDVKFLQPRRVVITGAVQKPGDYERSDGMMVKDLLVMAGGAMPNAYLDRAELLRYDYATGKYTNIELNIIKAQEGSDSDNLLLQDGDNVTLYTNEEKTFTPARVVSIEGYIQRPGKYTRFEGMKIKDLLDMAGGALPGAHDRIELASARTKGKTEIQTLSLALIAKDDAGQNILVKDGDMVTVLGESDFYGTPRWVKVEGEVKTPGSYALYGKNDRLSDIIRRAGGVTEFAHIKGTVFMRRAEYLPSDNQKNDVLRVNKMLEEGNLLEYERQVAKNRLLMQKEFGAKEAAQPLSSNTSIVTSGASSAQAAAIGSAPGVALAAGQTVAGVMDIFGALPGIAGRARKLGEYELNQSNRIVVNIKEALANKGDKEDLTLMEGDTIFIPQKEETVSVIGAVMRPTTVHHNSARYMDYIKMSGDYTDDANTARTMVMRVDGSICQAKNVKAIEPGDIIYVPTKVMVAEVVEKSDKVIGVIKYALTTVASVVVFLALLHMF